MIPQPQHLQLLFMGNSKAGFTDQAFAQIGEGIYLREVYSIFQDKRFFFFL